VAKKLSEIFATNPAAALDGTELVEFTQNGATVVGTVADVVALAGDMSITDYLSEDPATTTALTWGWKAGIVRNGATIIAVVAGTLALTASATSYIEVSATGVVSANVTAFTSGSIPLRTVVTGATAITTSTDERAWLASIDPIHIVAGNVGIGTRVPAYKLGVNGNGRFQGALNIGDNPLVLGYNWEINSSGFSLFQTIVGTGGAEFSINGDGVDSANTNVVIGGNILLNSNGISYFNGGKVGIKTTAPTQELEINGGIRLNTTTVQPAASATSQGTLWVVKGDGTTTADTIQVCLMSATGTYSWVTLATG